MRMTQDEFDREKKYQVVMRFVRKMFTDGLISKEEYYISEQTRLAENLELQQYQNNVRSEHRPLIYRHENIFEGDRTMNMDLTEQSVTNRVSSAVLLNLIDNLYQRHLERAGDLKNRWLFNQNSFYGSADKTFRRIESRTDYIQYTIFPAEYQAAP